MSVELDAPPLTIDRDRCDGCGWCVTVCPTDVFALDAASRRPALVYPRDCQFCGTCVVECHTQAIWLRPTVSFRAPPSLYELDLASLGPGWPASPG
jgi:ferredoxin